MIHLGQHFLKSKKIAHEIVDAAQIEPSDTILEVGPGKGILTEILLEKVGSTNSPQTGKVIAVEKDEKLVDFLHKKFADKKNLEIISGDILKISTSDFMFQASGYKIVANIPYYITSRFLKNFLSSENQPNIMVLMLQKEVAERIVAKDDKESILSISIKAYGHPKIIKKVPAKYFSPKPKVDSAIIKISDISKNFFNYRGSTSIIEEKEFFDLIRKGFSSKRKMLKNNLKISPKILKEVGLSEKIRAEELSLEAWEHLYLCLSKN